MSNTRANIDIVKINNKAAILDILSKKGPISRKDIAKELKITPATVTILCTQLIEKQILVEKGEIQEEKKVGRRKVLIDINYDYMSVVAVSIESMNTYVTITNLKGIILGQRVIQTESELNPQDFLKKITEVCKILLWENTKNSSEVLGVGISIPGIVNRRKGISENAYGIWQVSVPVKDIVEGYMDCPVIVENNIKAFAESELLYGMGKSRRNLLFVKWGPGVGSAIVMENQVYEGMGNNAAEIGHYILESRKKMCRCGRQGCLETEVSITAITEKIKAIYSKEETPQLYKMTNGNANLITGEFIFEWMQSISEESLDILDRGVYNIINECLAILARVVTNVITMLAPNHTILFGVMLENNSIRKHFLEICQKYDSRYDNDYISKSVLSKQISYIGAVTLVVREYFFHAGGC